LYILTSDAGFADALRPRNYRAPSTGEFLCARLDLLLAIDLTSNATVSATRVREAGRIKTAEQRGKKTPVLALDKPARAFEQI